MKQFHIPGINTTKFLALLEFHDSVRRAYANPPETSTSKSSNKLLLTLLYILACSPVSFPR